MSTKFRLLNIADACTVPHPRGLNQTTLPFFRDFEKSPVKRGHTEILIVDVNHILLVIGAAIDTPPAVAPGTKFVNKTTRQKAKFKKGQWKYWAKIILLC